MSNLHAAIIGGAVFLGTAVYFILNNTRKCNSTGKYTLYAWELSYFSGKVRSFLKYKNIPFEEAPINLFTLFFTIRYNTGVIVMPVVKSPENKWIQDSRVIIDYMEALFPDKSVFPMTPRRRFVSCLLETWGDEFWLPSAMQTRWRHEENQKVFEKEAGDYLLPWAPRFIKNIVAGHISKTLKGYLEKLGVYGEQEAVVVAWTDDMLEKLDKHFAEYPYLLGSEPTIGDFGLIGPLYAHLGRDPWPKRNLTDPKIHLTKWINRMKEGCPVVGDFKYPATATEDAIPPTLIPIVASMLEEMTPWMLATVELANKVAPQYPSGLLPRPLGNVQFTFHKFTYNRLVTSFVLWKAQKLLDDYSRFNEQQRDELKAWLVSVDPHAAELLAMVVPKVERVGLRVRLL